MAAFRSFRDDDSRTCLMRVGYFDRDDLVQPDLVFSFPKSRIHPLRASGNNIIGRKVAGLGVMQYCARYSTDKPDRDTFPNYLHCLVDFARNLIEEGYSIRLLIGDICDKLVVDEVSEELHKRDIGKNQERLVYEGIRDGEDLLAKINQTEWVVATRFHNVLSALLAGKPVIAISFHQKVASLMADAGLSDYCLDINALTCDDLLSKFFQLISEADVVKQKIEQYVSRCRSQLDAQYDMLAKLLT